MLFYPQLSSGAVAQFPTEKEVRYRTMRNVLQGGGEIQSTDTGYSLRTWHLTLRGLESVDKAAIESHFLNAQGRLRPFTFVDPFDNLLSNSENLESAVWQKDPGLVLTPGRLDPTGGTNATLVTNPGAGAARFFQVLPIPAWFQYSVSVYLRADAAVPTQVLLGTELSPVESPIAIDSAWTRHRVTQRLTESAEVLLAGVELPAFSEIECFGFQLEAQLAWSDYKRTTLASGVYSQARFDQDELVWSVDEPGLYSTVIAILANTNA